jgi:CRP-like cAMP-binding protein
MQRLDAARALATSSVFGGLDAAAIDDLALRVVQTFFVARATVLAVEEAGERAFLVQAGRVDAVAHKSTRRATVAVACAGDWCGAEYLFGEERASVEWVTAEPTTTIAISRRDLLHHLDRHPGTALHLLRGLASRLRAADRRIAGLAAASTTQRLGFAIARLARHEGLERDEGLELLCYPTQQDLANQIGARRETVSRIFCQLVDDGLLIRQRGGLIVTHAFLTSHEGSP